MERENVDQDAQDNKTRGKTKHEGDEGTVGFWVYMKALYKDEEWKQQQYTQGQDVHGVKE